MSEAARQEAESRYPNKSVVFGGGVMDDVRIEAFVAGAEWQRTHTILRSAERSTAASFKLTREGSDTE